MQAVERLMAHLGSGGTFEGTDAPRLISLICHQVLARSGDPRAGAMLSTTHADLQVRAAVIADAGWRDGYLNNIPEHREIVALWAASQGLAAGLHSPGSSVADDIPATPELPARGSPTSDCL